MDRRAAVLVSTAWFLLAPVLVGVVLPWLVGRSTGHPAPGWLRGLGVAVTLAGLLLVAACFAQFVRARGTPVPLAPTDRLVVDGAYRYVRNPMYVAVLAVIPGVALIHASAWVLAYGAAVWAVVAGFVLGYEEPTLRHTYGKQYDDYTAAVPRWLPRLTPWRGTHEAPPRSGPPDV